MNRLSRDALALFERAREQHEPTPEDRQRVRRALSYRLPAAAVVTTLISQAAPAAAGSVGAGLQAALVVKWLIGGALLGSAFVGVVSSGSPASSNQAQSVRAQLRAERPRSAVPARSALAPLEAAEVAATDEVDVKAPEAQPARSLHASPPASAAAPSARPAEPVDVSEAVNAAAFPQASSNAALEAPAPAKPGGDAPSQSRDELLREARALRTAQAALSEGRASDALELLRLQALQFPRGALSEERSAARLLALCALGQTESIGQELAQFLEVSKNSPLAPRVRAACEKR